MNYDKFTVYNASAGSGKTYTITEKLVERLAGSTGEQQLNPEQVIATTFTEKAASELESRIRSKLLERGMFAQAQALPAALIGTVNSVTNSILQKFAIDAGMNPDLIILEEDAQKQAFRIATEQVLYDVETENSELIQRVGYSSLATTYGRYSLSWSDAVRRICDLARTNDIDPEQLTDFAEQSVQTLLEALGEKTVNSRQLYVENFRSQIVEVQEEFRPLAEGARLKKDRDAAAKVLEKCADALVALDGLEASWDTLGWKEISKELETPLIKRFKSPTKVLKERFSPDKPEGFALQEDAGFRQDLADFIRLTFTTAQECMRSYAAYKEALGLVDFIDQEHLTLRLLRSQAEVRSSIADQYKLLVVDEFQDTSPLQLAIFMELAQLVDEVIWVGDPKQSIYRFRGADPLLMGAALNEIRNHHPEGIRQLKHSYRTHQVPLNFSNEIFRRVFKPLIPNEDEIVLSVPADLQEKHAGGDVHIWVADTANAIDSCHLVAAGIAQEIAENPEADVERAVLVRTNKEVFDVVAALTDLGVPVLGDYFRITDTREGIALRAALAFALDQRDTKALIELIQILHEHPAHTDWLQKLTSASTQAERSQLLETWKADKSLAGLKDLAAYTGVLSPADFVRRAIDAIDLIRMISTWNSTNRRFASLDGVVQAAQEYEEKALAQRRIPSIQGFLNDLKAAPKTRSPRQKNAVYVSTMHRAKGLEWEQVYVALGDHSAEERFIPAGSWAFTNGKLSVEDALANRTLLFWPESLKNFGEELAGILTKYPLQADRLVAEIEEEQRLYYVALTRSRKRTVLALEDSFEVSMPELVFSSHRSKGAKAESFVLDILPPKPSEEELAQLVNDYLAEMQELESEENIDPAEVEKAILTSYATGETAQVRLKLGTGEESRLDVTYQRFSSLDAPQLALPQERTAAASIESESARLHTLPERAFVPARFAASSIVASKEQIDRASVTLAPRGDLGSALVDGGGQHWNLVGDAVHGFLALPLAAMDEQAREEAADRIALRWGLNSLAVAQPRVYLQEAGRRWVAWLEKEYPATEGWQVFTEVPFTWRDAANRSASGWIDTLLMREVAGRTETVLIDHKTYPGSSPEKHLLENYVGQMSAYSQVLEEQTGSQPLQILMHLPMRGEIWQMNLS